MAQSDPIRMPDSIGPLSHCPAPAALAIFDTPKEVAKFGFPAYPSPAHWLPWPRPAGPPDPPGPPHPLPFSLTPGLPCVSLPFALPCSVQKFSKEGENHEESLELNPKRKRFKGRGLVGERENHHSTVGLQRRIIKLRYTGN